MKLAILDGYIDEPASLGVPPYISPVVRQLLGAAFAADVGLEEEDVCYLTVDDARKGFNPSSLNAAPFNPFHADLMVLVSNLQVPGKYLGGTPASSRELKELARRSEGEVFSWTRSVEGATTIHGDPGQFLYSFLNEGGVPQASLGEIGESGLKEEFALMGARHAGLILKSASYSEDYSLAELDTFKGCPRKPGCSFCPEWRQPLSSREPEAVVAEVKELMAHGVSRFRLGGSCFFSYLSEELNTSETPCPNPEAMTNFLGQLASLGPKVLHIDNANPAVIAAHPKEAREVAETIVKFCTPGNVASFGLESADPAVIEANNINSSPEDVLLAVKLLGEVGSRRGANGLPAFLPGLNLLYGLPGETQESFEMNFQFLKNILDQGLMLRRINIRQVDYSSIQGCTDAVVDQEKETKKQARKRHSAFIHYKKKVREEIDRPMLKRLLPVGSVLKDVYLETMDGKISFGRQLGSYPILVGIPYPLETGQFHDIKLTEHGFRSVTGIHHPFHLPVASFSQMAALPGVGKKRAARLFRAMPVKSEEEFLNVLDDKELSRRLLKEDWVRLDTSEQVP